MDLTFRPAVREDLDAFYFHFFYDHRDDRDLFGHVRREWHVMFDHSTTISMMVDDAGRGPAHRCVGFAQMGFVSEAFVGWAKTGMQPYAAGKVCSPLPDGSWPLLDINQVRKANSGIGVSALITRWNLADRFLKEEEKPIVRKAMNHNLGVYSHGYNYREILLETQGEEAHDRALAAGFYLLNDYPEHWRDHPKLPYRPYLFGITREQALGHDGSLMSELFIYTPPRFYFTPVQQELLNLAIQGISDEEITTILCRSSDAIKMRWKSIYEVVDEGAPDMLPFVHDAPRGKEKRRILLNYLREHPEELRPLEPRRAPDARNIRRTG